MSTRPPVRKGVFSTMLEIRDLTVAYGDIEVVHGVSLEVQTGEVVALLGANGAGKSSIMRAISGLVKNVKGSVKLDGKELIGLPAHDIVKRGLRHVPEGRRIFSTLTVQENLTLGAYSRRKDTDLIAKRLEEVYGRFPILRERSSQLAGLLSGGEQQMLALGRGLITDPILLALDEPSLGLSPRLTSEVLGAIEEIAAAGTAVFLVEQNATQALKIANRAFILELGRIAMGGSAAEMRADPRVQQIYLGGHVGDGPASVDSQAAASGRPGVISG
jgi:branched-chain amino acid transport system ATP-binding protein